MKYPLEEKSIFEIWITHKDNVWARAISIAFLFGGLTAIYHIGVCLK